MQHSTRTIQHISCKIQAQFTEAIKLLQFRKLYRLEGESAEEWMGRLWIAVVECNYKEVDRELKEQFIHGLNDRVRLDEIVRELTAKINSKQMNSVDVLLWAQMNQATKSTGSYIKWHYWGTNIWQG